MVVSALIGAGPTVGRVGEFGAFSRLFGGNLVSVSIDLEFVVSRKGRRLSTFDAILLDFTGRLTLLVQQ